MIWRLFYNSVAMPLIVLGLLLTSLVSEKVRRGIRGRMGEGERLRNIRNRCNEGKRRVIVHCASAGELESAIPLMQSLREQHDVEILLSYYSPSAVERAMKVEEANEHFYLPVDTRGRMRRMLDILEPSLIVFVKHDIWPNLVWEASDRDIPVVLVNGNFRPDSRRLKRAAIPFGRAVLPHLTAIYAVARDDGKRFRFLAGDKPRIHAEGDTRFDRVRQRALKGREDQGALAEKLVGRPVAVAGSTWSADEKRLLPAFAEVKKELPDATLLIVPHEPSPERIRQIMAACVEAGLSSLTQGEVVSGADPVDVVVDDRVGVLAGMYGLGRVAYVGGAFGAGVHSVIEPAVFGIPVLFGPKHLMSHEARDLIALGAAIQVEEVSTLTEQLLAGLRGDVESLQRGEKAAAFVQERSGVAKRLTAHLADIARW